ncbi:MAG: ATP-dependent DNA helicase [Verrucomicrobia bacterium]|nr:ATP-dependent DNA helicase [Verrucomicrobiota bacterium]
MIGLREDSDLSPPPPRPPSVAPGVARKLFAEDGLLTSLLELEHRPEQAAMGLAVARAFADDHPLLFEAGTGVGKSLAYLLPGIVHAVDQSRQLIVSTHTISLQEQLETKDLPLCRRILAGSPETSAYVGFRSCVLVGKGNYLCTTRLSHALAEKASLFTDDDYGELQRIADWADQTETGLRHELRPEPRAEVWDLVSADSSGCSRKHCDCNRCFYQRARTRLRSAQVIIVNHALLFALISAGGAQAQGATRETPGVLFPDDFLVLDEAHTVPEVATDNFGLHVSSRSVDRALKHLYNPRTRRGLLGRHAGPELLRLIDDGLAASERFFAAVQAALLTERAVVRLRAADPAENVLEGPLAALERAVARIADRLEEGRERDEFLEQRLRLKALQVSIGEWLSLADAGQVYWGERGGRKQTIITLRSAPLDIAPALRDHLFGCATSVVCTSATLAVAGQLDAFARRMGADRARSAAVASPFDYDRQMRVFVATDVPLPSPQDARLAVESLIDWVRFCALRVTGGTLVLFTSYADLRAVAAALETEFLAAGRPLLLQGDALSRTELAREMRRRGNAVLFGTESFWTGVDIPGAALSQVIVTRLPFAPPTHPVLEARSDAVREAGGNPFAEITLPDALIQFRQGIGRLIRSATDRGVITLLDSRVVAKTYGRLFLETLPQTRHERMNRLNREDVFQPFPS